MSKYNPEQVKEMAQIVMTDHDANGHRALRLFLTISALTGIDANTVRDRIRFLAHV